MARLRHFAVCVKDLDKAAAFYESVFDLKRTGREDLELGSAIYLTDGVINLALLNFSSGAGRKASDLADPTAHVGAHHFGFQVDDLAEAQRRTQFHTLIWMAPGPAADPASAQQLTVVPGPSCIPATHFGKDDSLQFSALHGPIPCRPYLGPKRTAGLVPDVQHRSR